jgi:hypothetical protein
MLDFSEKSLLSCERLRIFLLILHFPKLGLVSQTIMGGIEFLLGRNLRKG